MKRGIPVLIAALAMVALAGCSIKMDREDTYGIAGFGYLRNPESVVAAADWSRTQTAVLTFHHYRFEPEALSFQQGIPSLLRLQNEDNATCYFDSGEFFRAIAVQKLVSQVEVKTAPYYEEIIVKPGEVKELYFVPVNDGVYEFECASLAHSVLGNTGQITVTRSGGYAMPVTAIMPTAPALGAGYNREIDREFRSFQAQNIRKATRPELEEIKAGLAELIVLIREREASLSASGY